MLLSGRTDRWYLQARFARVDEPEHGVGAAKHDAAVWGRHGGHCRDGVLPIQRIVEADLLACGQVGSEGGKKNKKTKLSTKHNLQVVWLLTLKPEGYQFESQKTWLQTKTSSLDPEFSHKLLAKKKKKKVSIYHCVSDYAPCRI